jgi:hypothetical protein
VAVDETENNRGAVRHGDFCEGRVTVMKDSGFVDSFFRQTSFKAGRNNQATTRKQTLRTLVYVI